MPHLLQLTSSALGLVKGYFLIVLVAVVVFDWHPEENNLLPAPNFLLSLGQLSCRMVHIEVCLTGAQLLPLTYFSQIEVRSGVSTGLQLDTFGGRKGLYLNLLGSGRACGADPLQVMLGEGEEELARTQLSRSRSGIPLVREDSPGRDTWHLVTCAIPNSHSMALAFIWVLAEAFQVPK